MTTALVRNSYQLPLPLLPFSLPCNLSFLCPLQSFPSHFSLRASYKNTSPGFSTSDGDTRVSMSQWYPQLGWWHKWPCFTMVPTVRMVTQVSLVTMVPTVKGGLLSTAAPKRVWHQHPGSFRKCTTPFPPRNCRVVLEMLCRRVGPVQSNPAMAAESGSYHKRQGL